MKPSSSLMLGLYCATEDAREADLTCTAQQPCQPQSLFVSHCPLSAVLCGYVRLLTGVW